MRTMPLPSPTACLSALSKGDANVFHKVMPAWAQVSAGLHVQVQQAMPGKLGQHVVQHAVPSLDLIAAGAIQVSRSTRTVVSAVSLECRTMRSTVSSWAILESVHTSGLDTGLGRKDGALSGHIQG